MSKVYADAVATPEPTDDLTLGGSGDNVIVTAGATLKTNTIKDSGGNTLFTSDGSGNLSSLNAALKGNMVLLTTNTSSNVVSSSFTSDIDSTYKLYIFKFIDVIPTTDHVHFMFQVNADGGSGFNETITSSFFSPEHYESSTGAIGYEGGYDQAQGTAYQYIGRKGGNESDEGYAGELHLFNPSNTTYVKHFYGRINSNQSDAAFNITYVAGYINTTAAIDEIDFKMSAGNMNGVIKMYGVG